MIKLKTLILETAQIVNDIASFEKQLQNKYTDVLEQFHFYYDTLTAGIFLSDIYIKTQFRGKGFGTKIMKDVCAFADKNNLPISLIPAPESLKAGASRRLEAFYRRFGFGAGYGLPIHNADDMAMVRMPKKQLNEQQKRWSAVVLDDTSRNLLISTYKSQIPQGWDIIAHHQTINPFGLTDNDGVPVKLKVMAVGLDDKALAVKVSGYLGKTNNAYPHITIAINRSGGASPRDSNAIKNWEEIDNGITLNGTIQNL